MSTKIFDFSKEKTQEISLSDLKQSRDEVLANGKSMNGITHHALIMSVLEMMQKHNRVCELGPLYVSDNNSKFMPGVMISRELERTYGVGHISTILFNRMLTQIHIRDAENDEYNGSIAIAFHQGGIELAYGQNVKICSNLSILGGEHVRTYGTSKVQLKDALQIVDDWIVLHDEKIERDMKLIQTMKDFHMDYQRMCVFIGMLRLMAVKHEKFIPGNAPLNKSQLSNLEYEYLLNYDKDAESVNNLWKVYNLATRFHHAGNDSNTTEIPNLLECNTRLGNFIVSEIINFNQLQ